MKKIILLPAIVFIFLAHAQASNLWLFGGGNRSPVAMKKLLELANDIQADPMSLVITWPSSVTEETFQSIRTDLEIAGAKRVMHGPTLVDVAANPLAFKNLLASANIVFISGGDQNTALDFLDKNPLIKKWLQDSYARGTIFAGTSAGTAMMSAQSICGPSDADQISATVTCLRSGLGLLPENIMVDQHFIKRSRYNRLLSVLLFQSNIDHAIGINEDSCIWFSHNKIKNIWGNAITLEKKRHGFLLNVLDSSK